MLTLKSKKLLPWLKGDTLALQALSDHDKPAFLGCVRARFAIPERQTDLELFRRIMSIIKTTTRCPEEISAAAQSFKNIRGTPSYPKAPRQRRGPSPGKRKPHSMPEHYRFPSPSITRSLPSKHSWSSTTPTLLLARSPRTQISTDTFLVVFSDSMRNLYNSANNHVYYLHTTDPLSRIPLCRSPLSTTCTFTLESMRRLSKCKDMMNT